MCRVLGVSRGGYYTWAKRQEQPPSRREMANQELTAAIEATFKQWDSPKEVDKRKTLVHNMEEDLNDS
jgi:hypothetical protein